MGVSCATCVVLLPVLGPDEAVALARVVSPSEEERRRVLAGASLRCLALRRYDATRKLFQAAVADLPTRPGTLEERYGLLASVLFVALRRHEDLGILPSDPWHPAIRLMSIAAGVSTDTGGLFATDVGPVAPRSLLKARRVFPSRTEFGVTNLAMPPEVTLDVGIALTDFTITGQPSSGWRVRMAYPYAPSAVDLFVVLEGGGAPPRSRRVGLSAHPRGGGQARRLAGRGRGTRAGAAVD